MTSTAVAKRRPGLHMGMICSSGGRCLLIYAIETAAKAFAMTPDAAKVGRCIQILSEKTGIYGMIGGQTVDVELTNQPIPKDKLDFIYRLKTGHFWRRRW